MAGRVQTNFRAADMTGGKGQSKKARAPKPPKKAEPKVEVEPEAETAVEPEQTSGANVPNGTVDEILVWVGDDKELAQAAKDKELTDSHPRSTLLNRLDAILGE